LAVAYCKEIASVLFFSICVLILSSNI
jgi:hypothetical protein